MSTVSLAYTANDTVFFLTPYKEYTMSITQKILSLDEYYRASTGDKIIINDLNYFNIDDIESINNNLMTIYDSDVMTTVPSCDCGKLQGSYLLDKVCDVCGTRCKDPNDKVHPLLWMKALKPNIKFLNPAVWLMIRSLLHRKYDYVRWLCDPRYSLPTETPPHITGIKDTIMGGVRSYKLFLNKLPDILTYLLNHSKYKDFDKQVTIMKMIELLSRDADKITSTYLPIVNKKLMVMENTTKGKYTNLAVADIIDAVMLWVKISSDLDANPAKQESTTAVVISKLANLYKDYFNNYIVQKSGIFRKHLYSTRSHFTFRCVISSIKGKHQYDQIQVPFAIGVTAYRPHVLNKLVNQKGYTYKQASKMVYKAVKKYDPVIDSVLQELISESKYEKGIPVLALRNQHMGFARPKGCSIAA